MEKRFLISIDQSTQGTKALLLGENGKLLYRCDLFHRQIVNEKGWVSHDPEEIYDNVVKVVRKLIEETKVLPDMIGGLSISNQRETALTWNKESGEPFGYAVVWQCARGQEITQSPEVMKHNSYIYERTGIPLSPYFPAAKIAWLLKNNPRSKALIKTGILCAGTIDSWLIFKLTGKKEFKTDYSNASRTQLFDIHTLKWNPKICSVFGIPEESLAQICDSDDIFGYTDIEGVLPEAVPICGVMGDSHAALFGQGCLKKGQMKATYGTGTSVMMNIGKTAMHSENGLVTSIAWKYKNEISYVLEANLNYTGAVIRWLQKDVQLIANAGETDGLAKAANPNDRTYLVPAFSGLGAPYWKSDVQAMICGISRTTGKAEIVKAAVESIGYQIADVIFAMEKDMNAPVERIRVDGGATKNEYLMQFQSDLVRVGVEVPRAEELSGIGAGYMGGIALGLYDAESLGVNITYTQYDVKQSEQSCRDKYAGWLNAVHKIITE